MWIAVKRGIIVAIGRISKVKIVSKITGLYVLVMRGTPLLLQIIIIFYGLPSIGISISNRTFAALIAFVLNYAAYFGEIFRTGIQSIDKGQYEGAEVLGLSTKDTFFRIILPQAFKRIIPTVANEVITLVKDTSLVYVVGLDELLKVGKSFTNQFASLWPLIIVGGIYLIIIAILTKVLERIENKYSYYE